ncbi:MAG TPA: translocation/assembly module TamB domain-containing protein, partial [Candidatus Baltobacteraceae bacterium]|nr:translocation/assembly module TamB domain-containing protein [Candidatus Baltobacteraceae bacterium]
MNALRRNRMAAIGVLAALVLIVAVLLAQPAFSKGLVAKVLGSATGTQMEFGGMELHGSHATLTDVRVSAKGEQLARIPRIDVAYDMHDLLPGSKHLYGLHAITVYRPRVTVVHKADGTYNLPSLGKGGPSKPGGSPMHMTLRVIDGSLAVLDKQRIDPTARDVEVASVNFNANVDTSARTTYKATMAYTDGRAQYPIRGGGIIDTPAGYTLHHWTAAHVPLPQLVNYALNNANMRMTAGYLDNLDARYYGSISASAQMRGARIAMAGVKAPIDNVHGPLDMTSAGMTTSGLIANVAGAPVYVRGGIYDLKNPQFRITVDTHGELDRLKLMATPIAHLPLRGPVDLSMLVQGTVKQPLAMISLRSPHISFKDLPLRDADGSVAFDGKTANLLHFTLRYAGFSAAVRGRVNLQKQPNAIEAFASADGSSNQIPYAVSLLPDMPLHASLLATGDSFGSIQTQGSLYGTGGTSQLASAFAIASNGVGTVDMNLQNQLAARIAIDHPKNRIAALVRANGLTIDGGRVASLPGLHAGGLPPVRATVNGNLFAVQQNGRLGLNGRAGVTDAQYNGIQIASANATFGGGPGNMNVARIDANGSFGTLNAHGTFAGTNHVALEGRFHGSLAAISSIAGHLPATGTVDAPLALVYDRGRAIAQVQDARFANAGIRGIPLDGLSATVAQNRGTLDVYAAHAQIAHSGSAVAAGSIGSKNSHLAVSVANLPVAALHGAGVPLQSGTANLAATASGSLNAPNVNGAVVVDRAQYGKFPVSADTAFAYSGDRLALQDALLGVGPAFIALDGTVGGVAMGAPAHPTYDLNATLRGADADDMLAVLSPAAQKQYIEGSLNADVHVTGSGSTPYVNGTFDAPEGSVHGLAFRNLAGTIDGTPSNISVGGGRVTVGSTTVAFNANVAGKHLSGSVNAPHADLADFNDYFDQGDTLAGTGRLAVSVDAYGRSVASSGDVALDNVRYKRFPVGNTNAVWITDG